MDQDQPDEETVEVVSQKTDQELLREVEEREKRVQQALGSGNSATALDAALTDPPYDAKDQKIKDRNTGLVGNVLTQVKEKDIEAAVNSLSDAHLDTCMKYIYKLMESGENSAALLKWHEVVFNKGGLGCISRALAERKTV